MIYHIAFRTDWEHAQQVGEYRVSTRGRLLEDVGFIHCGQLSQVEPVANALYRDVDGLLLLAIDPEQVRSPIRYDEVEGSDDPFPHIYGPLNVDAVVDARPFQPGSDGRYTFPDGRLGGGAA